MAWTFLAILAVAMLVSTLIRPLDWLRAPGTEDPSVGQALPWLELAPLTGDATAVALKDLRGRVTVLNFWGTWCPPCRTEFPHLVDLYEQHRSNDGFLMLAVSCPRTSTTELEELRKATQEFIAQRETDMPTYVDPAMFTQEALNTVAALQGYPMTVIFDRHGTIRGIWRGYSPADTPQVEKLVAELLTET